jgi:hypothetical protein
MRGVIIMLHGSQKKTAEVTSSANRAIRGFVLPFSPYRLGRKGHAYILTFVALCTKCGLVRLGRTGILFRLYAGGKKRRKKDAKQRAVNKGTVAVVKDGFLVLGGRVGRIDLNR